MITAFDSDVLIYAADPTHPRGKLVRPLLSDPKEKCVGSVVLKIELLPKPLRADPNSAEVTILQRMLANIELIPCYSRITKIAVSLSTTYKLKAADAIHLATAIYASADRFITNNRKDFPQTITEIDIIYPEDLA
jgi:predicted nucleic acid-binding protein